MERVGSDAARRVILVGNDDAFGRSLESELAALGFEVELATPAQAIEQVASHPPELVVLDLSLPDGGAITLLRRSSKNFGSRVNRTAA